MINLNQTKLDKDQSEFLYSFTEAVTRFMQTTGCDYSFKVNNQKKQNGVIIQEIFKKLSEQYKLKKFPDTRVLILPCGFYKIEVFKENKK